MEGNGEQPPTGEGPDGTGADKPADTVTQMVVDPEGKLLKRTVDPATGKSRTEAFRDLNEARDLLVEQQMAHELDPDHELTDEDDADYLELQRRYGGPDLAKLREALKKRQEEEGSGNNEQGPNNDE